jgi:L-threonylcarbamoyladenylate synthase
VAHGRRPRVRRARAGPRRVAVVTRPRLIRVDAAMPDRAELAQAADVLRAGGLVAFPTETVYGLGANALDPAAVARVFAAKGRPSDNPMIVHAPDAETAWQVTEGPTPLAMRLASRFWPGPLTLVLNAAPDLPRAATAGLPSVAVRVPDHPVALALLRAAGVPVAAPSANRSGRPSPTTAAHVLADLGDVVDVIVDGGPCAIGVESTVVDVRGDAPVVLREGAITRELLAAAVARAGDGGIAEPGGARRDGGGAPPPVNPTEGGAAAVDVHARAAGRARPDRVQPDLAASPGTRYRHYAPACRVVVAPFGTATAVAERLAVGGVRVGLVARDPAPAGVLEIARYTDAADLAMRLYGAMRDAESAGVTDVVVEAVPEVGIGRAVMDRLRRAAEA